MCGSVCEDIAFPCVGMCDEEGEAQLYDSFLRIPGATRSLESMYEGCGICTVPSSSPEESE